MAMLELEQVCCSYKATRGGFAFSSKKEHPVLHKVSFSLEEGACLGLLGSSGAGKSTIGKIVLGVHKPDRGLVKWGGKDLYSGPKKDEKIWRQQIQAVFQDCYASVNPKMTARQIVEEPLLYFRTWDADKRTMAVVEALELCGLSSADLNKYPSQFSGGQLQRICLARALVVRPKLIVLDESVSSLDMVNQSRIIHLLASLRQQLGMSYLFITHNLKAAFALSDRLIVLDQGRICGEFHQLEDMYASPHVAVQQLLKATLSGQPERSTIRQRRKQAYDG